MHRFIDFVFTAVEAIAAIALVGRLIFYFDWTLLALTLGYFTLLQIVTTLERIANELRTF